MNPQAQELNEKLPKEIFELLSEKGKNFFFPKRGIIPQTAEAKGKKINATIGIALEEDSSPMRLSSIAKKCDLHPEEIFPYASSLGLQELKEKWKKLIINQNPKLKDKSISLPLTTHALTHGLNLCGCLFLNKEEKIIIPSPYWGNYKLIFENWHEGTIDEFEQFKEKKFNVEGLKEKLLSKGNKKVLLLNFPGNPTGYNLKEDEVKPVIQTINEAAMSGKNIVVIVDDAYFGLNYENNIFKESLFSSLCDLHERVLAVKVDGATKEYFAWGLRVGFITFGVKNATLDIYQTLESKTAGAIRGSISNVAKISQSLLLKSLDECEQEKKEKFELLKKRYLKIKEILKNNPQYEDEFISLPFNSGYFMCVKLNKDAEKVRKILLDKYDTGVISMGNLIRIAYSSVPLDNIEELFNNLYQACLDS